MPDEGQKTGFTGMANLNVGNKNASITLKCLHPRLFKLSSERSDFPRFIVTGP